MNAVALVAQLISEHHELYDSDCGTHFGCSCEARPPVFDFESRTRTDGTERPQYWAVDERRAWWERHLAEKLEEFLFITAGSGDLCAMEFVYENHPHPYVCSQKRGHEGHHAHLFLDGKVYTGPTIERKPQ